MKEPLTPIMTHRRQDSPLTSLLSQMDRRPSFSPETIPALSSGSRPSANATFPGALGRGVQADQGLPLYVRLKRRREEDVPPFLCLLHQRGAGEDGPVRAAKQQKVGGAYEGTSQQDHGLLLFRHVGEPPVLLAAATETVGNPEDSRTPSAERRVGPQGGAKEEASAGRPSNEDTCLGDVQAALQRLRKYRVVPPAGGAADHDADTQGEGPHEPSVSASREAGQKSRGRAGAVQRLKLADGRKIRLLDVCPESSRGAEISADPDDYDFEWYSLASPEDAAHAAGESRLCDLLEKERGETLSAQAELIRQLIAGGASANLADSVGADAMGLIELEDVDEETGEVLRGCRWGHCRSVDVFLGEFGDIDDPDSDDPDGAELDYPEDSDDDRERRFAARVRHLIDSDDDERAYSVSSDLSGFSEE